VRFDKKRTAVAIVGVVLPFFTWVYAKAIDERLVFGDCIVVARSENRRQFLRIADASGGKLYEEVLELGGALFAASNDSFLLSECARERCPTVWRYRLP
jgi:hypothetical protein